MSTETAKENSKRKQQKKTAKENSKEEFLMGVGVSRGVPKP
jgi:hypothetical protein